MARGTPEPERALGVRDCVVVAVEKRRGRAEVGGGVDAGGELLVRHGGDEGSRLVVGGLRLADAAGDRVTEREHRGGGRDQRALAQLTRRSERARRPVADRFGFRAEQRVDRELDHEGDRVGRRRIRELVQTRDQARVRLLVTAEQALDAGARRRQLHAKADRLGRGERDALEQVGMALGEASLRGERASPRQQQADPLLGGRGVGHEAQRGAEPPGGTGGGAKDRRRSGLREYGHGRRIPVARRELDVMRPRRRRRAALCEDLRAALVRAEQPPAGRALVHRAPHERVAEAEAPRDVGGTHEPEVQELVERRHGGGVVRAGRGGGELGLERVAGDGRAAQDPAGVVGQEAELLGQRGDDRRGHADGLQRRSGERRPPGALGAGELLEVERVAARLLEELVRPLASDGVAEQVAGRLAWEAAQLEPSEAALAIGALEGRREAIG